MSGQGQELHGPAQASGQLITGNPREKILHLFSSLGVVNVVYFGNREGRVTGETRFNGNA
jgi:hypothetical protein